MFSSSGKANGFFLLHFSNQTGEKTHNKNLLTFLSPLSSFSYSLSHISPFPIKLFQMNEVKSIGKIRT